MKVGNVPTQFQNWFSNKIPKRSTIGSQLSVLRRLSHLERKFSLRVQTETTLLITLLSIALNCKARRGLLSDMKNSIGLRAVTLDIW